MEKHVVEAWQLFNEAQELIQKILGKVRSKPAPMNLPELHIKLKDLVKSQLELGEELLTYEQMPKYLYYHIAPGYVEKITTGADGVDKNMFLDDDFISSHKGHKKCPQCLNDPKKKNMHRIVDVLHGFTVKGSFWGEGIPVYREQCTCCGAWRGGFVLEKTVNAGL